jgi:nucleoprotein TPR
MSSQKKISELYQSKSEQLTSQNEELEQLVRDMEIQIMKQMDQIAQSDSAKNEQYGKLQQFSNLQRIEIESLQCEIAEIKDAIPGDESDLGSLSKTAQVASRLQKSGQSFTEVYADYAKLKLDLVKEKKVSAEYKETLDLIIKEVEHRKPFIDKTARDLEKAKLKNDELSTQMLVSAKSLSDLNMITEQTKSSLELVQEEKHLLEKDVNDMSRQIQALLKQMNYILPGRVLTQAEDNIARRYASFDEGLGDENETEALIAEKLVVFKNIEELQNQNITLRRAVRSISQKMEMMEKMQSRTEDEKQASDMLKAEECINSIIKFLF